MVRNQIRLIKKDGRILSGIGGEVGLIPGPNITSGTTKQPGPRKVHDLEPVGWKPSPRSPMSPHCLPLTSSNWENPSL